MRSFEAWKKKQLKNPVFKAEYDRLGPEFEKVRAEIVAAKKTKRGSVKRKTGERPGRPKTFRSRAQ